MQVEGIQEVLPKTSIDRIVESTDKVLPKSHPPAEDQYLLNY
jgi:hypothetical protein